MEGSAADLAEHDRVVRPDQLAARVCLAAHDHRLHQPPAVRDCGIRVQHLQRRDGDDVLADARLGHLTGEHALAPLLTGPFGAGDDPLGFAGQPNPAALAEPELVRPLGERVDPGLHRHLVEEGVGRLGEGVDHGERSEALPVPVVQALTLGRTGDLVAAVRRPLPRRGRDALLHGGDAGDQLVRRARWVDVGDRMVAQRPIRIGEVDVEVLDADASREPVVVVGRQRHHRQDLARLRVHDDRHALADVRHLHAPDEGPGREALDLRVDGQHEVRAGLWLLRGLDHLELATGRVPFDELCPVRAAQLLLERGLDPGLADHVVAQIAVLREGGELVTADRPGVADDVRQQRAVHLPGLVRVRAHRLHLDDDARQPLRFLADDQRDLARHATDDRHELVRRALERVEPAAQLPQPGIGEARDASRAPAVRSVSGRSAGRTWIVHDGVLTATGRPARSKMRPRGAGSGTSTVRSAAARRAYSSPLTTCSWKSLPPSAVNMMAATTLKARNRPRDRRRSTRPSFMSAMRLPGPGLVGRPARGDQTRGHQRDGADRSVQHRRRRG